MIKTSVILFVIFYLANAHSQQTIDKLNSNQLKLPKETISKALSIDATGQVKSSATSDTELGYLSGVTSAIQTQINDKANDANAVHLTGDESISGIKTLTGKLVTSSTVNASIPCPVMTQTQRDAIVSPVTGDCVFNSDTSLSNIYDGAIWKAMGGSGGGIGLWVTANGYAVDDVVIESNNIYICLTAHTSGTFATDLASLYWLRLSTDVTGATGLLPLATGGTNKSVTASNGSIVYSDTDSLELLSPGTSGQILQTNGVAAPTFVNKSISGKAQNKTAVTSEEIQFPNNLLTETGTNKYLSESGNKNILDNPSFEHSTFSTFWTNSAGTFTQETSVVIDGKASAKLVLSAQTMALTQSSTLYAAQFADGVQGLAMVRIKSDIALSVCSIQAGTVSTTNCVTTATDSKWGLYKIPFILGATSNGVSIASTGSVTGTVYIDDAFVGAVDLKVDIDASKIAGESYFAGTAACDPARTSTTMGAFTADADCPGPTIATSSMGTWATTDSDLIRQTITNLPAGKYKAKFLVPITGNGANRNAVAINDGTTTCESVFGEQSASSSGVLVECFFEYSSQGTRVFELYGASTAGAITVTNSSTAPRTSTKFILEYFGNNQVYSAQCGANCVNTFSAKVSSVDVASEENADFISGNCTNATTGRGTCTYNSGIFTVAPNCTLVGNNGEIVYIVSQSSSAITYETRNSAGVAIDYGVTLSCQKQGADFVATRTIQGSFKEVNVSPGITKPKTCHYAFGGAAATLASPTECTTGTCVEMFDSCGAGSAPTFSTTGNYLNITFANGTFSNSSYIDCRCESFDANPITTRECTLFWGTGDQNISTNSSGGYVVNTSSFNDAGTAADSFTKMTCSGSAP